jgi:hypothetical protein
VLVSQSFFDMTNNPYSAPSSNFDTSLPDAKKPIAFLIMQILMIPSALLLLVYAFLVLLSRPARSVEAEHYGQYFASGVFLLLFAWAVAILVTAHHRSPAVRWLGGSAIALPILAAVLDLLMGLSLKSGSHGYVAGQLLGRVSVIGLECYWLYAFAFAPKARRYLGLP